MFHANSQNFYLKDLKIKSLIDFRLLKQNNVDVDRFKQLSLEYKNIPLDTNVEITVDYDEIN